MLATTRISPKAYAFMSMEITFDIPLLFCPRKSLSVQKDSVDFTCDSQQTKEKRFVFFLSNGNHPGTYAAFSVLFVFHFTSSGCDKRCMRLVVLSCYA